MSDTPVTVDINDVDLSVNTANISIKVDISNGLFYTTESGTPIVADGSNTYLIKEHGIQLEVGGVQIQVGKE